MSASASAEDGGASPPASSSPQPFPGQQAASPSATTPPVTWHPAGSQPSSLTAAVRPSSEGKVGSASEVLKNGAAASSDDEGQLGQRGLSTGAGAAAASVPQPAGQGDGQPAASSAVKSLASDIDIEALIALATSHSPPPGYVPPDRHRSGTPNFVYPQSGGGGAGDTRVALFVGNLPFRVRWQDLKDLMRRAGTVLRADVALGPDNRSKGHGMVLMGSREDGMRAIEMFHGYNWQTRILEVRPERLPPEYEQHATPMQQSMPRPGSSPAMLYQQQQQQQHGLHGVANMLLNHAHGASQQNGFNMGSGGMRSASPYNGAGVGRPPLPHGSSPMQAHHIASPTPLQSNLLGATATSTPSPVPSSASPSLSAALLNHNQQQQIARALTPKATSVQPSSLAQHQADMRNLEIGLAGSLRLGSSPQLPSATTVGSRAPPPGSLGSLPPPPAFAGMSHAQQPAYAQIRQADGRASSRSQDSLAGRVLFVGNLPFHVQWQDLKDLFRSAGNIQRANVALGGDGRSRGFGSVQYSSKDDAEIAIGLFDGYELNGRKLQVHHESAEISRPGPQATQAPYGQQPVHLQQQQQLTFQQQQQPFQHQQQQQQHARQQPGQLSMSFSRLPAFGHDASYYVPPSPFHAPTSPYLPPQSPAGYGPPSSFPYFPATFATGSTFGSSYSGAQMASTTLSSTAEEPSRAGDANPSSNRASAPMPSPIGPPRGHPPGRIALPPAYPFNNGPSSAGSAMSPMHGRGLPMLTPSMPSFQFHNGFPQTPPLFPQFLSPGLGPMSPPLHSPPFFNPYLNTAPGAPMFHPQDNPMFPPSAMYNQAPASHSPSHGEVKAGTDEHANEPVGAPVFASLSRDESVASDRTDAEVADEDERSKTPTLVSATLPASGADGSNQANGAA